MPTLEHLKICKIKDLMFFALLSLKLQKKEKQIYKPDSTPFFRVISLWVHDLSQFRGLVSMGHVAFRKPLH